MSHEDQIPGGLADKKLPEDFDPEQLAKGVKVELEHTEDEDLAQEIAMDHLAEDPKYYDKLEKVEKHSRRLEKLTVAEALLRRWNRPSLNALADRIKQAREDVDKQEVTDPDGDEPEEKDTQNLLKENGDLLITVLKTVKPDSDLRRKARQVYDQTKALQSTLKDFGKQLVDAMGGTDEELKDLDQSAVGEIKAALDNQAKELDELLKVGQLIKNYEKKADKPKTEAVQHKLPQKSKKEKEKAEIKPKKEKDEKSDTIQLDQLMGQ